MIPIFSNTLGKEELQAVEAVFKSKWIGKGKETEMFQKEFGEKIGCPRTLAIYNCTSALFNSMKILNIGPGDEVIIPSIHFIGTANAIINAGAKPVFADVDTKYFNILPEEIKRLRNENTKAVFLLHYGGHPCNMDEVLKVSEGLYIIEDSANSPVSKYKGQNCGTLGDIGCFSFDSMKILCVGNGGAICLKDEELYDKAMEYIYFGLSNKGQSGIDALKEKKERWWEIELNCISDKSEACDILSSIGRVQLKKIDKFIERRKQIWDRYQKELSGLDWLETPPEPLPETESSYYLYWIKTDKRDKLAKHLVDNEIYCTFRYFPLHLIKYYGSNVKLPNAELINEKALNIPLHQNLSDEDVFKIIKTIKEFKQGIEKTELEGLIIINPDIYEDERGCFFENYNEKKFKEAGLTTNFVQDNQSISKKGVFRGFHFQKPPFMQGKLVRVIKGKVLDICIDVRKDSLTYKQSISIELSEENKKMMFIPEGLAHGFLALEDDTIFQYKCTNFYNKESETGIRWNDPGLKIDWQLEKYGLTKDDLIIAEKDKLLPLSDELGGVEA